MDHVVTTTRTVESGIQSDWSEIEVGDGVVQAHPDLPERAVRACTSCKSAQPCEVRLKQRLFVCKRCESAARTYATGLASAPPPHFVTRDMQVHLQFKLLARACLNYYTAPV